MMMTMMMIRMIKAMKCIEAVKTHVGLYPQIVAIERCVKNTSVSKDQKQP
jgi:hypothetical protein